MDCISEEAFKLMPGKGWLVSTLCRISKEEIGICREGLDEKCLSLLFLWRFEFLFRLLGEEC